MHDVPIAGGVEHATRALFGGDRPPAENSYADETGVSPTYFESYDTTQGGGAERITKQWGFDRESPDELDGDSQRRWGDADAARPHDEQVVTVETEPDDGPVTAGTDEHPHPETDAATLADLPLAFREEGGRCRCPRHRTVGTAGSTGNKEY